MPRGYRLLIVAACGIALLIALGLGAFFGALNAPHYGYQTAHPAYRSAQTEKSNPSQVDRDRAGLPYLAERIASGPDPKDTGEREQRDLAAQESMSIWAFWLLLVSAAGTATTMIGTGFLLWQIVLTRKAVEDTGKATNAMERQNNLASAAQRAWVAIDPKLVSAKAAGNRFDFDWRCAFVNKGGTVARNVRFAAKPQIFGDDAFERIPAEYEKLEKAARNRQINIIPGEDTWGAGQMMQSVRHIKWTGEKPFVHVILIAVAHYQIEGDDEWRCTARAFALTRKGEGVPFSRALYKVDLDGLDTANVEFVPFGQSVST